MPKVVIYHNPRCSKSRRTLALLEEHGVEPEVVEYLREPPDEETLAQLVAKLEITPDQLVRTKDAQSLGLDEPDDPAAWIELMARHPKIIERPIVVVGDRARLGRPPEQILDILPT